MGEHRMGASTPKDAFEARLERYLDWEGRQAGGSRSSAEIAASIGTLSTVRRGPNLALGWAAVIMAVLVAAAAIAVVGSARQSLVTAPSDVASVVPTAGPTNAPATETPATGATVTEAPDLNCIQFDAEAIYTANVGTLPVGVAVPASVTDPWRGQPDAFYLGKGACDRDTDPSPFFHAALVGHVYRDACHWKDSRIEVPTAFSAAEELARQKGHATTEPVQTRIGAFRATRLDISVPSDFDDSVCDEGDLMLWPDKHIIAGFPMQIYIAEVDGTTLAIIASYDAEAPTPPDFQEIDSILASLRVDM